MSVQWALAAALALVGPAPAQANLLQNPGAEQLNAAGQAPLAWRGIDFRTGGTFAVATDGGQSGQNYLVLRSANEQQRACWSQRVPVPEGCPAVSFGGWYRTVGVAKAETRGASVRIHFHRAADRFDEIGLRQWFYAPAEQWTRFQGAVRLPPGTRSVEIQVFSWLTPGQTHWDQLQLAPVAAGEVPAMPLPDDLRVDREPQLGRNLPYHPADGDTVTLNPPPLRWLPSGGGVTYRLELARDAQFAGAETVRLTGLTWCAEMLTRPLATGVWYWRYGVDRPGENTIWSRARRFTVPAGATPWPYPGRDALAVPDSHPRLFVTARELPALRRRAQSGDLAPTARNLLAAVKRFAGEPLIAEPARLVKEPLQRGEQYAGIIRDTRPPMDRMETAGLAYLLTGDAAAGQEAKRRLLHFFGWDPQGSSGVFHNDEPAMWIMMRGMRAYDWTYDLFTPDERARVEASMKVRATEFYQLLSRRPYENNPYESHAGRIIGFLGEAAIEFAPQWPEARVWLDYITRLYWGVWPAWGKDDGGWNEGPGYWAAYMTFALHYVVALRQATGVDLAKRPFFANTPYYRLYLTPPYSSMSPFGDGYQAGPSRVAELMSWFSSLNQDPRLRWYCDSLGFTAGSDVLSVVLKDDSLLGRAPVDLPQGRLFDGTGLAVLHTDLADGSRDVMFAMRSTPYGAVSHGHNDQNCFVIEAAGEPLAIATGYYPWYGSRHHDLWTRQTKARNGITIDGGQGQDRGWAARGAITAFVNGEAFDYVEGDATPAYGGRLTKAIRQVVHVRPGIFVIRDRLVSAEPRRFEFRLHSLDQMAIDQAARTVVNRRPKAQLTTRFLLPEKVALTQDDRYDPPVENADRVKPQPSWHLTAATDPVPETEFLTVLVAKPTGDAADPPVSLLRGEGAVGVRLGSGADATIVAFRTGEGSGPLRLADLSGDGRVMAVRPDGALLVGGTQVGQGDRVRLRTERATTVAVAPERIDTDGPGGPVEVVFATPPQAFGRGQQAVAAQPVPGASAWRLSTVSGRDRIVVWRRPPVAGGPVTVAVRAGDRAGVLTGVRFGAGHTAVGGRVDAAPGAWALTPPAGYRLLAPEADEAGRLWLLNGARLDLRGQGDLPAALSLRPVLPAVELAGRSVKSLPAGQAVEAEQGYSEVGGRIEVSRGGHAGASAGANLWAWNAPGHRLSWTVEVPRAGRYTLWLVGASETGLLLTAKVGDSTEQAVFCRPTGGWARNEPNQWQAFELPARLDLPAGRQTLTLTNRSGLGLNLDRLVLVAQP